jgi:hypothetical protein
LSFAPANASDAIWPVTLKVWKAANLCARREASVLREAVTSRLRDPALFWEKFAALPTIRPVPAKVILMLKRAMPESGLHFRVAHRRAGLGAGPRTVHGRAD